MFIFDKIKYFSLKKCFAQNIKENCRQNNVCCVFLLLMFLLGHRIQGIKKCCNDNNSTCFGKNISDEKGRNSLAW